MKVKLADVLWDAANKHLWDGQGDYGSAYRYSRCAIYIYSCDAAGEAGFCWSDDDSDFLRALGCDTCSMSLFYQFPAGPERQGARYLWLLLAMHVAEDEGIEIEVTGE